MRRRCAVEILSSLDAPHVPKHFCVDIYDRLNPGLRASVKRLLPDKQSSNFAKRHRHATIRAISLPPPFRLLSAPFGAIDCFTGNLVDENGMNPSMTMKVLAPPCVDAMAANIDRHRLGALAVKSSVALFSNPSSFYKRIVATTEFPLEGFCIGFRSWHEMGFEEFSTCDASS